MRPAAPPNFDQDVNNSWLERAQDAWEEGRLEDALRLLERVKQPTREACVLRAQVLAECGAGEECRAAANEARELHADALARGASPEELELQDRELLHAEALCSFLSWRLEEAQERFEQLLEQEGPSEATLYLAVLHDIRGDSAGAEALERAAHEADPEHVVLPLHLGEEDFERRVQAAAERLPPTFQAALESAVVNIAPVPTPELIDPEDPLATPPDLLGLFSGTSRLEAAEDETQLPTTIWLFQRNIERHCDTLEALEQELAVTLYHELGHLLGFDEQGLAEIGLE